MNSRHNFANGQISSNSTKNQQYQYNNANSNGRYAPHHQGQSNVLKASLMSSGEQDDSKMQATTTTVSQKYRHNHHQNQGHNQNRPQFNSQSNEQNSAEDEKRNYKETTMIIKCDDGKETKTNKSENDIDATNTSTTKKTPVCVINEMVRASKVNIYLNYYYII